MEIKDLKYYTDSNIPELDYDNYLDMIKKISGYEYVVVTTRQKEKYKVMLDLSEGECTSLELVYDADSHDELIEKLGESLKFFANSNGYL